MLALPSVVTPTSDLRESKLDIINKSKFYKHEKNNKINARIIGMLADDSVWNKISI
jgi:hypothetical protein